MPGGWRGLILTAIVVFPLSDLLLSLFGNGGSTTISYTEFNNQLNKGNITKIYSKGDAIEGVLKNAEPEPDGKKGTYTDFDTQRPVFAGDELRATLQQQNVVVTAEPVVQQRSFLANLLISLAPMLLLVLVRVLPARRMAGRHRGHQPRRGARRRAAAARPVRPPDHRQPARP